MTAEIRALQALEALNAAMGSLIKSCASRDLIDQLSTVISQAKIELDLTDE